jgi:tetratricopeptide (TPR) repeat protein
MKKVTSLFTALLILGGLSAQEMPAPSPAAMVMQRVGLTDITIEYSRPGVKSRMIFGDLVPYNKLWRTGANKATLIKLSTDAKINDQEIKAGSYSIFTIPGEEEWVVIFNKDTELWGTGNYTQRNDALRIRIPSEKTEFTERFTIHIDNMTDNSADIIMAWSTTKIVLPVTVEVEEQTEANITQAMNDGARAYRNGAEYYSKKGDHEKALSLIDQSIAMNDNWYSNWVKAKIILASGDKKAAKKQGEKALEMGEAYYAGMDRPFPYKEPYTKEMKSW